MLMDALATGACPTGPCQICNEKQRMGHERTQVIFVAQGGDGLETQHTEACT